MPATTTPGVLAEFAHRGQTVRFFVSDIADVIQNQHINGYFYEPIELDIIAAHFPAGGVYLDIGANVGNHLVYMSKFCAPSAVIAVEPNPSALRLLHLNLLLNALPATVVAMGLSDAPGKAEARWPSHNLGGARMMAEDNGRIQMIPGDDLFADRKIDFMKIDVEAQELAVLRGLARTIAANRPTIFVEVDDVNREAMDAWIADNRYQVARKHRRYVDNENLLLLPL
ncbi:MAG: FkbM family methyltransferase [Alphaproteobacteria bacterium]|nr:FkbM family methyltransferase [Alphaproteobacteria bacterium]MBU1512854.1 FkbM family methyltransferase [Alphaproteobacteria bacterium]MBU2096705.1 FkbM family methyltransferase [Alphaproteobacteria bacterium]MBU2150588.1 FkbM family methyltransferase [Alphaproteobacteria bacterium]MBU2308086.1 FkbM family methyltransferase [Alphaproteobacteria bacterium]